MIKFRYLLNYFFRIFILIICHILFLSNNYIYAGELSGTFSDLQTGDTGSSLIRDFPDSSPMSYQNVYVGKDANGNLINTTTYKSYYDSPTGNLLDKALESDPGRTQATVRSIYNTTPFTVMNNGSNGPFIIDASSIANFITNGGSNGGSIQSTAYRYFTGAFSTPGRYSLTVSASADSVSAIYVSKNSTTLPYNKSDPFNNFYSFSDDSNGSTGNNPWTIYYEQTDSTCTYVQFLTYQYNDSGSGLTGTYSISGPGQIATTCSGLGSSASDTDTSLNILALYLKGVINYQSSSLNQSLNYDCSYFGKNNFCMSGGLRNTNTKDNDSQSAVVIAAAKINNQLRVGGYIDEVVRRNFDSKMKLTNNTPMIGVFAKYNEQGDFGLKASLSAGYIDQDVKSTRTVSGTSEPGSGTSSINTTGIQAEIKYGISHSAFLTVSPYVGYRNTQTTRDKYTEETSSSVTSPLTYNKIKQNEETLFAGVELKSHFNTTDTFATLNFGYEHANKFSINNLSTTGVSGTSDINLSSNIDKTRPVLMASFNKDLDQAGRLSLNFDRREHTYSQTNSTNLTVQYMVGF
jgi:hypothetical protein